MDERYRRIGRATLSRPVLAASTRHPVDLLACALWVVLDALGNDGIRIDTWTRGRAAMAWMFNDASAEMTVAHILEQGAVALPTDAAAPTASVRWAESAVDDPTSLSTPAGVVELVAHARDDVVELETTDLGLDREPDPDALAELVAHVACEIAMDPNQRAGAVQLVLPQQRMWLVEELNSARLEYPKAATVDELMRQVTSQTPGAVALETDAESVTYAALLDRANVVADTLRVAGVRAGEAVGVMFPRSVECVAAMLGVLLAGAVYVPIALEEPEPRRERLLDLLSVRLLLHLATPNGVALTTRDAEGLVVPGRSPDDAGSSPLYVMFTSGSTGEPKAVVVSHRSAIRLVRDPWFVGFSSADGVGFASNPGFDAATWEVWGALCNGARLIPIAPTIAAQPEELQALIRSRGVTCLFLTTSLFNSHARTSPAMFGDLRILGIGGEAADPSTCKRVLESDSPPDSLLNAYGPTESTTFASWYRVTQVPDGALRLPIGLPICNTTLHVLDRHQRLVPPGVPGELFIGGDGLALGYLNDPELTDRKFIANPFAEPPARMYASGDLVVREPGGDVVFLRRLDDQLKIRGFRVEPLEIEAAIRAMDGVSTAVVVPRTVEGYPRLVAYVIADSPHVEASTIRSQLRTELPDYLVPSHVVIVGELPLTKSGKLDRSNLPDPFASSPAAADDEPTLTGPDSADARLTGSIADIWRDVLGVREVDSDATFFDAGGDSLLAVRLYGAVQRRFGVVLASGTIDQNFTLARFTEAVRDALSRAAPPMVTEMTTIDGPVIVLVAPGGGELDRYRWLVPALADRFHVVGVREPGHYGTEPRPRSMTGVSAACSRALRDAGIGRPVAVIGECSGGVLAHQLACDLSRDGHVPDLVVLLDTPVPGPEEAEDSEDIWSRVATVRRRGRNAVALTRMQTQWTWYRMRHLPAPRALAHSMTLRNNARRVREALPPLFDGRVLYVQAVDVDGTTVTDGGPEYWSGRAESIIVVTAPGSHTGTESFLSRSNAGITADAIRRELSAVQDTTAE